MNLSRQTHLSTTGASDLTLKEVLKGFFKPKEVFKCNDEAKTNHKQPNI